MKTAVEWLIEAMYQETYPFNPKYSKIFEQAKEMEKEQMCKFASDYVETQCNASFDGSVSVDITTEEYYNLTFKSE
jgi:hemoglobin-like flavoprotein